MARFYGTVQGARGPTSRLGHARSGLHVTAQSYNGDVRVYLTARDGSDDKDWATVHVMPHDHGTGFCLFNNDVSLLLSAAGQKAWIKSLVKNNHLRDEIVREFAEEALIDRAKRG